jgi:predicted MFS family arabinose efflux permease
MRKHAWTHIARTAAALAAAMGTGRFAYTPILPLMTAHAHLTTQSAGQLATANYVGYLVGAVAAAIAPRWPVRWPRAAGHWWSWWQAGGNGIHHQRH